MNFVAKTLYGLEEILASELKSLGAKNIQILTRAVSFTGDKQLMYAANYNCRTALHVLLHVFDFTFHTKEQFYEKILNFEWSALFSHKQTISVDTVMSESIFTNSHYVSLLCKDAVADYFRKKTGFRPSVDIDNPDIKLHVFVKKNKCSVSLDSSGGSLHRRGYRISQGTAPLSEVLAAGIILLSGWDKKTNFFDPMCGSGTLVSEAALIAAQIPPGYYKKQFGFQKWSDYDENLWQQVKNQYDSSITEFDCEIVGSDINNAAISVARQNLRAAKLHKDVRLNVSDFKDIDFPAEKGVIITNPPYGERIKPQDIITLYKEFGNVLKRKCKGYQAWIISSHFDALKFIGLKPSQKIKLFNGPLECKLVCFDIFEGSLKHYKSKSSN